jgi:nucleoside-diphosphate-sugar epimerase
MIIGSGLVAKAFFPLYQQRADVCIYAAGVSNSNCTDTREFQRERARLNGALQDWARAGAFVYFGTCSSDDAEVRNASYVQHKLAMEQLVASHPKHLILRLPQLAGVTPNPHTLLNFLYARIARSEAFSVWRFAYRNIIDVQDVANATHALLEEPAIRQARFNLANPTSYAILDIVEQLEKLVGKRAIYDVCERGHSYAIDVTEMLPFLARANISFDDDYLGRILRKYYEIA